MKHSNKKTLGRIVKTEKGLFFLYYDHTYTMLDDSLMMRVLISYRSGTGLGGYQHIWHSPETPDMFSVPGQTMAFFDNEYFTIVDASVLNGVLRQDKEECYVSVTDYAMSHHCSATRIKKLCAEGRITGATKVGGRWLIHKFAEYPADMRLYNTRKNKTPAWPEHYKNSAMQKYK